MMIVEGREQNRRLGVEAIVRGPFYPLRCRYLLFHHDPPTMHDVFRYFGGSGEIMFLTALDPLRCTRFFDMPLQQKPPPFSCGGGGQNVEHCRGSEQLVGSIPTCPGNTKKRRAS